MQFTNICPVCNSKNDEFKVAPISKWMLYHLYGWRTDITDSPLALNAPVYRCDECDFVYFSGRYDSGEMNKIYSDYQGKRIDNREIFQPNIRLMGGGLANSQILHENRKNYFKDFIANLNLQFTKRPRILDFGGNGSNIPEHEYEIFSYDVGNESTPKYVRQISSLEDILNLPTFDMITNTHVLEHISEPQALLQDIRGICKKETYLYLEVPYEFATPINQPSNLEKCLGLEGIDEHINKFNVKSLLALLTNTGFSPIKIDAQTQDWAGGWVINVLRVLSKRS